MSDIISVNLVKGRKPHFIDQFIGWALTVGRALVILTETIALSAFLYRFGLDRQIIDLHDKITQDQNIVRFLQNDETKFRNLQNRLQIAQVAMQQENQTIQIYQDILHFVPADMTMQTFTYSSTNIVIQANTKSIASIATFTNDLKHYTNISSVSLDKIDNNTQTGTIDISITANIKSQDNSLL